MVEPGSRPPVAQLLEEILPIHLQGTAWRKTWHTDSDAPLRWAVVGGITQIYYKRIRPSMNTPEWRQRLPFTVKRIAETLYRLAMTKEEFADQLTLDTRILDLAKRVFALRVAKYHRRAPQLGSQTTSSSLGNMMSTPGSTAGSIVPSYTWYRN